MRGSRFIEFLKSSHRFMFLLGTALLIGTVFSLMIRALALRQIQVDEVLSHTRLYNNYLQIIEKNTNEAGLAEVRRNYPQYQIDLVTLTQAEDDQEHDIIDGLANEPHRWRVSGVEDGWIRSFFLIPAKEKTALQIVSSTTQSIAQWRAVALRVGLYLSGLLFFMGLVWMRAHERKLNRHQREIIQRIQVMHELVEKMGAILVEVNEALDHAARESVSRHTVRAMEESAAQIKLLSINGSIEAARNIEAYRVFHVILHEINGLATQMRQQIHESTGHNAALYELRLKLSRLQSIVQQSFFEKGESPKNGASRRRAG